MENYNFCISGFSASEASGGVPIFSVYMRNGSVLERLVLKNVMQRTSRRIEGTSGASDMSNDLSLSSHRICAKHRFVYRWPFGFVKKIAIGKCKSIRPGLIWNWHHYRQAMFWSFFAAYSLRADLMPLSNWNNTTFASRGFQDPRLLVADPIFLCTWGMGVC